MKRFLVFGIKRNGNHAIISYILGHLLADYKLTDLPKSEAMKFFINNEIFINDFQYHELPIQNFYYQVVSFEDKDLDFVQDQKIIVLRDPYNWVASIANNQYAHYLLKDLLPLWVKYAKSVLKGEGIFCNYNKWCVDKEYRKQFSRRIGLAPCDSWYNCVLDYGGGSSFDGLKYDMGTERMATMERWKLLTNEQKNIITQEMRELSRELFDFSPF